MPQLNDFLPIIIPALALLSALFAFIATSVSKGEEKKSLSKLAAGFFVVLIIASAGASWYLLDSALAQNKHDLYLIDQQQAIYRARADSLRRELAHREANTVSMTLLFEESQAQLLSMEKSLSELETRLAGLDKNRKSKDSAIAALERDKRELKDKMVEVAKAAQNKVQSMTDSLKALSAKAETIEAKKPTNSKLAFTVSTNDTSGSKLYRNTYYTFFAEPKGELENVSIYFKFDRAFLDVEDVSDDAIRGRRTSFFAEAGNTGVYYRISYMAEGEVIVLRLSGNDFILPRPLEPPVLFP